MDFFFFILFFYLITLFCKMDSLTYFRCLGHLWAFQEKCLELKTIVEKGHVKCSIGHFDKPQNIFNMFETIFQCNFKCWFQIYIQFFLSCLELEKLQLKVFQIIYILKYFKFQCSLKILTKAHANQSP